MWITLNRTAATEIDDSVVKSLLSLYPEEGLIERKKFKAAFENGYIEYKDLVSECDKLLLPWQMFLLNKDNFKKQIDHIEQKRADKIASKLVSKRSGIGQVTSKRIIDRLIRQQEYLINSTQQEPNKVCGSLKYLKPTNAAQKILELLKVDQNHLWNLKSKSSGLEYLINKAEAMNINVSRGVLANKLLPHTKVVFNRVYKNTSGFVIKDKCVPFIFLPSEINPDEVESRQIYSLIYLIVIIGLDQYEYFLETDFTSKIKKATGVSKILHLITTEILIPRVETEKLDGKSLTKDIIVSLSLKFKVSTLALLTTLLIRKVITKLKYDELKPAPFIPNKVVRKIKTAKVSTSVKKFCGTKSFNAINNGIKSKNITKSQAQYLIFGSINKIGYYKYCKELGL